MSKIKVGNFEAEHDGKGNWIYKLKEPVLVTKVKPKYREKPQFKLQEVIEGKSKAKFNQVIHHTTIELINFLKDIK